jgi:hypothetical protein
LADNFTANAGSGGSTFASDECTVHGVASIQVPRIKLGYGADGTYSDDVSTSAPLPVRLIGMATSGCSIYRSLDLDETEEEVKATAGTLYGFMVSNMATSTRFLKFYNATAANVTVGSTTPVMTWAIPGNSSDDISAVHSLPVGVAFSTAITVAATTGLADNDTGAPSANDVIVNIFYV